MNRKTWTLVGVVLAALVLVTVTMTYVQFPLKPVGPDLLTNGSFEQGDQTRLGSPIAPNANDAVPFTGWQLYPSYSTIASAPNRDNYEILWMTDSYGVQHSNDGGSRFVDLTGFKDQYTGAGIQQTINLPNGSYELSVDLSVRVNAGGGNYPEGLPRTMELVVQPEGQRPFPPCTENLSSSRSIWKTAKVRFTIAPQTAGNTGKTTVIITGGAQCPSCDFLGVDKASLHALSQGGFLVFHKKVTAAFSCSLE